MYPVCYRAGTDLVITLPVEQLNWHMLALWFQVIAIAIAIASTWYCVLECGLEYVYVSSANMMEHLLNS